MILMLLRGGAGVLSYYGPPYTMSIISLTYKPSVAGGVTDAALLLPSQQPMGGAAARRSRGVAASTQAVAVAVMGLFVPTTGSLPSCASPSCRSRAARPTAGRGRCVCVSWERRACRGRGVHGMTSQVQIVAGTSRRADAQPWSGTRVRWTLGGCVNGQAHTLPPRVGHASLVRRCDACAIVAGHPCHALASGTTRGTHGAPMRRMLCMGPLHGAPHAPASPSWGGSG
jgi:hypothetical protein